MKEETKKLIEKIALLFSPVFTIIMFALPWCSFHNREYNKVFITNYASYIDLLRSDINVVNKVLLYITLVGVFASVIVYILSVVLKDKEKLLTQVSSLTLLIATGLLVLSSATKVFYGNVNTVAYADFMTLPYGLLLVYNVVMVILVYNKKSTK